MNLETITQNDVKIISVRGAIDSAASMTFEQYLNELIQGGAKKIVLDFTELDFTSSAGLRAILKSAQAVKESGGVFTLCGLNESVAMIFELTGFNTILKIYKTRPEALAGIG